MTEHKTMLQMGNVASALIAANPILGARQVAVETDTGHAKIGDGIAAYNSLPHIGRPQSFRSVKDYGAVGDGSTDDTAAFNAALAANTHVYVPASATAYVINGTVEMVNAKRLELAAGATLRRLTASSSTDPMVWMRGLGSTLTGAGSKLSTIVTQKASPLGLVCIGYKGAADNATSRNSSYNTVSNLAIAGNAEGGETTGTPSVLVYMCGLEISGPDGAGASYFNLVHHLVLDFANIGVQMAAYSNGNFVHDLIISSTGNNAALGGAAVKLVNMGSQVPLENSVHNIFHNYSTNATTIALSGAVFNNVFSNIIAEPGGASSHFLVNDNDSAQTNVISGIDNTGLGIGVTDHFLNRNAVTTNGKLARNPFLLVQPVSGVVTLDARTMKDGAIVFLSANATSIVVNNPTSGQVMLFAISQDATTRTFAWPTNFRFAGGSAPISTGTFRTTWVTMLYSGSLWKELSRAENVPDA